MYVDDNERMPPRFAYWTILIDDKPTAFRARDQQELLPTLTQLKRTNQNVVMKWFAQGRLWDSPEAQRETWKKPKPPLERRGRDWRPGGDHKDPRARFSKEAQRKKRREERAASFERRDVPRGDGDRPRPPKGDRPWSNRPPRDRQSGGGGWSGQPGPPSKRFSGAGGDRPWSKKPQGERRPWTGKPAGGAPRPASQRFGPASGDRPWQTKPTGPRAQRKPWQHKPAGAPSQRGDEAGGHKPWSPKPGGNRPWSGKPQGDRPWKKKPFSKDAPPSANRRRRRDDEPPDRDK